MLKSIAIIEAPSILGLQPTGVERLPDALFRAGLLGRLHARHAGRVNAPVYSITVVAGLMLRYQYGFFMTWFGN